MARDRSATATTDAKILALHRRGTSTRDISALLAREDGITLGKTAVQKRLDRMAGEGAATRPSGRRRGRGVVAAATASTGPSRAAGAPATGPLDPVPADTGDPDVDTTRARLRRLRGLIDANEAKALGGEMPITTWAQLVRLETELTDRVVAQVVPEPARPEDDPVNVQTAAKARAKLATLVKAAEADAKCASCGGNPWAAPRRSA